MGHVNYIVVDDFKIKFQISRDTRTDEFDDIRANIESMFKEAELVSEDVLHEKTHSLRTKNALNNIAYKFIEISYSAMEEYLFYDFMLMYWLTGKGIPYRVISEYSLDDKDEPAKEYITMGV